MFTLQILLSGATSILDCRKTYQSIDPAIIKRMTDKKLMYVRNFIDGLDVSWQQFFQTADKKKEYICLLIKCPRLFVC